VGASVARRLRAEPGTQFLLEVVDSDVSYHRGSDSEAWLLSIIGSP